MEHGAAGTKGCLEFVGAERNLGREADAHQYGDGDQSAAARDGIDQAGDKGCSEEQRQENFRRHVELERVGT